MLVFYLRATAAAADPLFLLLVMFSRFAFSCFSICRTTRAEAQTWKSEVFMIDSICVYIVCSLRTCAMRRLALSTLCPCNRSVRICALQCPVVGSACMTCGELVAVDRRRWVQDGLHSASLCAAHSGYKRICISFITSPIDPQYKGAV